MKLGQTEEAARELERAAKMTENTRERELLLARVRTLRQRDLA
jgi:predicted RNA polymerase sigma factor